MNIATTSTPILEIDILEASNSEKASMKTAAALAEHHSIFVCQLFSKMP
jgi:hypothetical protein